jgi:hypothetical protein
MNKSTLEYGPAVFWRVPRKCNGGACVRVALVNGFVLIGDSKYPDGPVLSYTREEFEAFVESVKSGDLDDFL